MNIFSSLLPKLANFLPGGSVISGLLSKLLPGFKDAASSDAAKSLLSSTAGGFAANGIAGGIFGQHEVQDSRYDDQVDSKLD